VTRNRLYHSWAEFTFHRLSHVISFFVVASSIFLALLLFCQVWLRYVFHLALLWVEEVALIPAFWLYLLGAAYGAYERSHIKVDVVHVFVKSPRRRLTAKFIASLFGFALVALFIHWGYGLFIWDIELNPRSYTLRLPFLYAHSSMLVGGILMGYYFLVETVDLARQVFRGKAPLFESEG
jgi:TRAP-type C4-dicarboxylate transport system permease small subunit